MTRSRLLVVAAALVIVALALAWWTTTKSGRDRRGGSAESQAQSGAAETAEGVAGRTNDPAHMRVRGRVVDDDGEPLEGGTIALSCLADDKVVPIANGNVPIADEGAFEGPGCAGTICAELHHPAAIAADPWVLEVGLIAVLRATTLPRLWGVVEDEAGEPVADARVRFVAPKDAGDDPAVLPFVTDSTSTDVDGHWSVALVERPPCDPCREAIGACAEPMLTVHERVDVLARAAGHAGAELELDLGTPLGRAPENPVRLGLSAPAEPLHGTLRDPEGRPYPRAQVLARAQAQPLEQHSVVLDDDDTFAFAELGDGVYELRALQDGVELVPWTAAEPGDRVELTGTRRANGPDVIVEVTEGGRPAANVRIDGGPFRDARTDMQGQVRASRVLPGSLQLRLRHGARRAIVRAIEVPDVGGAEQPRRFTIALDPSAATGAAG